MKQKVAVLMTVYNRKNVTQCCLKRLFDSATLHIDRLEIDVYLVDDASTDGTKEMVKSKFPQVNLIEGDGQLFWNRGMRLAWEHAAKGNYHFYLWLNDDTFIYDDALALMLDAYADNDCAIIVGATHAFNNNRWTTYGGHDKIGKMVDPNGSYQKVSVINGNFVLVSQSVFHKCGLLPFQLHHSGGDNYYSIVARKNNIPCILMPNYVGTCEDHEKPTPYQDPHLPIYSRIRHLYSSSDNLVRQGFFLANLDKGCVYAVYYVVLLHLHAFFPSFFKLLRKLRGKQN